MLEVSGLMAISAIAFMIAVYIYCEYLRYKAKLDSEFQKMKFQLLMKTSDSLFKAFADDLEEKLPEDTKPVNKEPEEKPEQMIPVTNKNRRTMRQPATVKE